MSGPNPVTPPPRQPAALPRVFGERPLVASLVLIALASLLFWTFPAIDHAMTGLFYSRETWFPARTDATWMAFRGFGIELSRAISAWILSLVAIRILFWDYPAVLPGRALAFLISTAALGPGLIVNVLLKDFWGRPRPHMVVEYGGSQPYTRVWEITDRCAENCSFVSGEAAASFWLIAFVFLLPKGMRAAAFAAILLLSATLSLNRVAFGGHFFSDVVISWSLTLFVILAMKRLVLDAKPGAPDPYDRFLTGIGRALAGLVRRAAKSPA